MLSKIFETDDIGAGCLCLINVIALGEHRDTHILASAVWQYCRSANDLVRLARIDTEIHRYIDALGKLRDRQFLDQAKCLIDLIRRSGLDLFAPKFFAFGQTGHYFTPSTSIPMLRAVPATVRTAASISAAVRSGIFVVAISSS